MSVRAIRFAGGNSRLLTRLLRFTAGGAVALGALAQQSLPPGPIPKDHFEVVTPANIDGHTDRSAVLQLLGRARENYLLRSGGQGYDLKVTFTVNSGGQTEYDGFWQMEDVFDPAQGFRWSANTSGYAITEISVNGMKYGEQTGNYIPLRLQEARAALFDPIPSATATDNATMRSATVFFNGAQLACALLSGSRGAATTVVGRRWAETEECIDPQSGLLRLQSLVPGRYFTYDYSNAPGMGGRGLPRSVTITEGGQTVTEIHVESLTALAGADSRLFQPTAGMKTSGPPIAMGDAKKIFRNASPGPFPPGAVAGAVCIFGLVTPSGQLVEAHSLQPQDPDSQAALDHARQMQFPHATTSSDGPQQHFVFMIEKFASH